MAHCDQKPVFATILVLLLSWIGPSRGIGLFKVIDETVALKDHGDALSSTAVQPSPKCWQMAITLVQKTQLEMYAEDASKLCAYLPEAHQKRLALEIAQCHLHDLGKRLYKDEATQRDCSTATIDIDTVQMCLKQLTDAGANSYTMYLTYVQNLCTRLTQELVLRYQQDAQRDMTTKYTEISHQSIEQMQAISDISKQHAEQMETLSRIPDELKEQLTVELNTQLKETLNSLDEQLKDKLNALLQSQASEHASFFEDIMNRLELRDTEHQIRYEDWTHYQTSLWTTQAQEMQRQRSALDEHRKKMENLSETVAATTENIQPLIGLQSLVKVATEGYTWITFLLHFLGTFNVAWVLTRPERCHPFRSYLFGLVLAEAVLELALTGAVRYNLFTESQRIGHITELRKWALFLECITYAFGVFMSCFSPSEAERPSKKGEHLQLLEQFEEHCLNEQTNRDSQRSLVTTYSDETVVPDPVAPPGHAQIDGSREPTNRNKNNNTTITMTPYQRPSGNFSTQNFHGNETMHHRHHQPPPLSHHVNGISHPLHATFTAPHYLDHRYPLPPQYQYGAFYSNGPYHYQHPGYDPNHYYVQPPQHVQNTQRQHVQNTQQPQQQPPPLSHVQNTQQQEQPRASSPTPQDVDPPLPQDAGPSTPQDDVDPPPPPHPVVVSPAESSAAPPYPQDLFEPAPSCRKRSAVDSPVDEPNPKKAAV